MKETIQRDTPVDLFNNILKTARNAGALQELDRIIDYDSACEFMEENRKPISHYEFSTVFSVDFGGSEGIYIDAWLHGHLDESGHTKRLRFGTIKTLESSLNAMKIMGKPAGFCNFMRGSIFPGTFPGMNPTRPNCRRSTIRIFHVHAGPASARDTLPC